MKKILILVCSILLLDPTFACTALDVQAEDGTMIAGRTMEWAYSMDWQLAYYPPGSVSTLSAPDASGLPAHQVKNRYGVFGVVTAIADNALLEGQNSAGLGLSGNFLPGFTTYPTVSKQDNKYLSVLEFGKFVLGNFATVAEVVANIKTYKVWAPTLKKIPVDPTVHFMISDKSGHTLVIEFIAGEMKLFERTNQVLTNSPTYDWHLTNARNYLNLSNTGVSSRQTRLLGQVTQFGQGGGLLGIPGDYTPPSRFVKTSYLKFLAKQPADASMAIELTDHILNNVDIPLGVVSSGEDEHKPVSDYTQWVAIKDLNHHQFYFADYKHRTTFIKINLNQIFASHQSFTQAIESLTYPTNDITATLVKK